MTDYNISLPIPILNEAKRFFQNKFIEQGMQFIRRSKVSISFKKGDAETYYITSGIVKTDKVFEVKVVYKKRLEGTEQSPLSSQCNCQAWTTNEHCSHTAALYLYFNMLKHFESQHQDTSISEHYQSHHQDYSLGARAKEFGTVLTGPHQLESDLPVHNFADAQYILPNKRVIPFPSPIAFYGKLILCFNSNQEFYFKWKSDLDDITNEVSIFEHLYLFNWKKGEALHLSQRLYPLFQRLKNKSHQPSINDLFLILQENQTVDLIELIYEVDQDELFQVKKASYPVHEFTIIEPKSRFTIHPADKKGVMKTSFEFFKANGEKTPPDPLFSFLDCSNGILNFFKKKYDTYEFITSLKDFFLFKKEHYKKLILLSEFRHRLNQLLTILIQEDFTYVIHEESRCIYKYSNEKTKAIFLGIADTFGEHFFRFAEYLPELYQVDYELTPQILFQGLSDFHRKVSLHEVEIFYDRNEISKWNSRIKFERRSSSTKWFDLELNISEEDLALIKSSDIDSGMVITKNGLILLSKEQKDLIRFLQKYTKFESTEESKSIDGSKVFRKFVLPFNRARIFELFELRKMGIDGALTEEEIKLCERLSQFTEMPTYPLPSHLEPILRPYQKVGFNWLSFLYEHGLGACLADDMGLGKTLQTIAFLQSVYHKVDKILVVCPVSILLNWENEIKKFSDMEMHIYHGGSRELDDKKIILTSYGVMKKEAEDIFSKINFDIFILDEVQNLKNIRSLGAFSARKINAQFRIALTGTPVENDLSEFYNILDLSMPGIWGDLQFVRTISNSKTRNIAKKAAAPFILRRTKSQVLHDLPPKIENNVILELSDSEKEFYHKNLIQIRSRIQAATSTSKYGEILRGLLNLRQSCLWQNTNPNEKNNPRAIESTKIDFLLESLELIMQEGHQAIIFSQFTTYLDLIQHFFKERHWKYSRIDGSQSINKRQAEVDLFQAGTHPLFLISLKAGGVGLNLTAASYVFIMDPWWNPAVESQAIDRAYRIGQKNTLTVYRPIIKNSVEEKVLKLQEEKKQLFNDLLSTDDDQVFSGKLSMKDFESLFN